MTTTSYSGNQTTVTDPAGNSKTATYDGLGNSGIGRLFTSSSASVQ